MYKLPWQVPPCQRAAHVSRSGAAATNAEPAEHQDGEPHPENIFFILG